MSQGLFRRDVLKAYGGACAVSGTSLELVLDAAHIQPFVSLASNHVQNGIPLRRDVHRLFDAGLITLRSDYTIQVSARLAQTPYADLEGRELSLPADATSHPSIQAIQFHRDEVFRE